MDVSAPCSTEVPVVIVIVRQLKRHASISASLAYHVGSDAKQREKAAWAAWREIEANSPQPGNTLGDTAPKSA